jgi:hypothetical protein
MGTLNCHSTAELVRYAVREGIVKPSLAVQGATQPTGRQSGRLAWGFRFGDF